MTTNRKPRQIRLFLGVKVSMTTLGALAETAEHLRRLAYDAGYQIRWVAPATYHVTLQFLGWTQPEAVEVIRDRLQPRLASIPAFEFTTVGLGAFPSPKHARVLWAGVDDPGGRLAGLAALLQDELEPVGFARETRPFHAHVTLGRVKRVDDVSSLLQGKTEQNFRTTRVFSVTLFESIMKSDGSEYSTRVEMELFEPRESEKRHTQPLQQGRAQTLRKESERSETPERLENRKSDTGRERRFTPPGESPAIETADPGSRGDDLDPRAPDRADE